MNWYKTSERKTIEQIAKEVLQESIGDEEDLRAMCLPISEKLKERLIQNGYNAIVVQGTFAIDNPNEEYYDDLDEKDYDEDEIEKIKYNPLHYWVEIDGLVVDITAQQFNDELDDPLQPIEIGTYEELGRWTPVRKDWK